MTRYKEKVVIRSNAHFEVRVTYVTLHQTKQFFSGTHQKSDSNTLSTFQIQGTH